MPKGPKGEKPPADVIGAAVKVMQIATGEIEETTTDDGKNKAAVELGRKGGKARAEKLSKKRRSEIAKKAAAQTMAKVDLWHARLALKTLRLDHARPSRRRRKSRRCESNERNLDRPGDRATRAL